MPSINIKIKRQLPDPMEGERAMHACMHGWGGEDVDCLLGYSSFQVHTTREFALKGLYTQMVPGNAKVK